MKINRIIVVLILITAYSCSSLKVKVDILNREKLKESAAYQSYVDELEEAAIRKVKSELVEGVSNLKIGLPSILPFDETVAINDRDDFLLEFNRELDTALTKTFVGLNNSITESEIELNSVISTFYTDILQLSTNASRLVAKKDQKEVSLAFNRLVSLELKETLKKANEVLDLLGDPLASYVTHASKDLWKGAGGSLYAGQFNKATAKTKFGNSDIAIAMEGPGNYVIKGVRLDPSDVIKATFKTIQTGISVLAAAQGVPVSFSDGDGAIVDYGLKIDSVQLVNRLNEEFYKNSMLSLLEFMANQEQNLRSDSLRNRASAISAIQNQVTAIKLNLNNVNK